jgi:hypothetical protein
MPPAAKKAKQDTQVSCHIRSAAKPVQALACDTRHMQWLMCRPLLLLLLLLPLLFSKRLTLLQVRLLHSDASCPVASCLHY